jgi:hypothetical protein
MSNQSYRQTIHTADVKKKKSGKLDLEAMRKADHELVRGTFRFNEVTGGKLSFHFKKYKGDPIEKFTLVDGQEYELPLMVAKHLSDDGWYPVHETQQGPDGKSSTRIGQKVKRFDFVSKDFLAKPSQDKKIVTVETVL